MLQIRHEQMEYLDELERNKFYQRLISFLREEMPEESNKYNDEELLAYIKAIKNSASSYRIETESALAQLICLTFVLGTDLENIPEFSAYMKDDKTLMQDGEEKLEKFIEYLILLDRMD